MDHDSALGGSEAGIEKPKRDPDKVRDTLSRLLHENSYLQYLLIRVVQNKK
jgi:hypothetical protein